jgi:hypothetical protein
MSKSDVLLESLKKFFSDENHQKILKDILSTHDGPSLRKLESFITVKSKHDNISYTTKDGRTFTVYVAYKSSLSGYSKRLFDPFCRTDRITFMGLSTTVAQLNFIRWCIQNDVIYNMSAQTVGTDAKDHSVSVQ